MLATEEIVARAAARWHEISQTAVADTINYARILHDYYETALARNFQAHPHIFGDEPSWFWLVGDNTRSLRSHRAQMDYLIEWLENRALWLDTFFNQ
jgi:hypothetical protein